MTCPSRLANAAAVAALLLLTLTATVGGTWAVAHADPPGSLTGQLLVATPRMPDPRFMRTVLFMVRHDATGALGLVLNRPIGDVPMARLLEQLGLQGEAVAGTMRVHYGGPVEGARGSVLHTPEYVTKGTSRVNDAVAMTSHPDILRDIATGAGPRRTFFALGYAGWAPGQLEAEIQAGHWVGVPGDEALVFDEDYEGKWHRAMARLTINL